MEKFNKPTKITGALIAGIGLILLGLNIYLGGTLNIALPLVFLLIGGVFFILAYHYLDRWNWVTYLYIPGSLLVAFGVIFLINNLTKDWNSWAYSWLLLIFAAGIGLLMANREQNWPLVVQWIGLGMAVLGITFFAIFSAIAGGLFIQVMAPILLIAAGLLLRFIRPESIFPPSILNKLNPASQFSGNNPLVDKPDQLVEPLSSRELEVLQLIEEGLSNQQIADRLIVAVSTVKTHINNIYGKVGVETRVQAIKRAHELNLIRRL